VSPSLALSVGIDMIPKRSGAPVLFKSILVALLVTVGIVTFNPLTAHQRYLEESTAANYVVRENLKLGSQLWWSEQTDEEPLLEGFSTQFSYEANHPVTFKISVSPELLHTTPTLKVQLWIFRLGYYSGIGATLAGNISYTAKASNLQPNCLFDTVSHMTDCDNWHDSLVWDIPGKAPNGIYVAIPVTFHRNKKGEVAELRGSYIPFVVRQSRYLQNNPNGVKTEKKFFNSKFGSDILFKTSDMTWVVYNRYGGWNLYRGNGSYTFDSRATHASYNRPFQNRQYKPQGQFENFLFGAEYPLLFWLEKHGYDVSYASCEDVENLGQNGDLIPSNFRILLSVGHDEYYTQALRDSYKNARNAGVNLAFFSSNEMFWRSRWKDETVVQEGVEYVRTVGKGNLSLSHYTTEKRENENENNNNKLHDKLASKNNLKTRILNEKYNRRQLMNDKNVMKNESNSRIILQQQKEQLKEQQITIKPNRIGIKIRSKRIIICAKETINGKPFKSSDVKKDWTGTFSDARFRTPEPENSLTGQRFAVNGFRSDAIEISESESSLRFWRNTDFQRGYIKFPYKTEKGYLGYEWDIFSDNCHRPKGLFSLSSTTKRINKGLSENFGESYKGTDTVTHKLSLYRHICTDDNNKIIYNNNNEMNIKSDKLENHLKSVDIKKKVDVSENETKITQMNFTNVMTSLIFASGTLQWSYALSTLHDGPYVPENKYLQQATINLFADMNVQPGKLIKQKNLKKKKKKKDKNTTNVPRNMDEIPLILSLKSTDYEPPYSIIEYPGNNSVFYLSNEKTSDTDIGYKRSISSRKRKLTEKDVNDYHRKNNNGSNHNDYDNDSDSNDDRYEDTETATRKMKTKDDIENKESKESKESKDTNNIHNILNMNYTNMENNKLHKKKKKHRKKEEFITIKGFARDRGGGRVAGVEISTDNGVTWKQADGTSTWEYIYKVKKTILNKPNTHQICVI
jgi:Mo-co oxidoreductase dimerisation domain